MHTSRKTLSGVLAVLFVVGCAFQAAGCSSEWKQKFVRKKKTEQKADAILNLKSDQEALLAPPKRYRQRHTFWRTWHSELLDYIGENRKRDIRNLEGVNNELDSMATVLTGTKKQRLLELREDLVAMERRWKNSPSYPWRVGSSDKSRLQSSFRVISREFRFSEVEAFLIKARAQESSSADSEA